MLKYIHALLQGEGMMRTYWLSGLLSAGMEDGLEASQYEKRIDLDTVLEGDQLYTYGVHSVGITVDANVEGKISVADSGIHLDKCMEDRCVNKHLNNDLSIGDDINTNTWQTVTDDKTTHPNSKSHILNAKHQTEDVAHDTCASGHQTVDVAHDKRISEHQTEDVAQDKRDSEHFILNKFVCEAFNRDLSMLESSKTDLKSHTDTDEYNCTGEAFDEESKHVHGHAKDMLDINIDRHGTGSTKPITNETFKYHNGPMIPKGGVRYIASLDEINNGRTEDDAMEEDIRLNKSTTTKVQFNAPARRSATDFMAVHNNWFDDQEC